MPEGRPAAGTLTIRPGTLEDIPALVDLLLAAYQGLEEYGEESPEEARHYLKWLRRTCKEGFLVAEAEGRVVGFVAACPDWKDWELGRVLEIHEIAVAPAWQGKGVGRALLEEVFALGRSCGMGLAALWVGEKNHRARRWYTQLGFRELGQWGEWVRMIRPISGAKGG